LSIILETNLPGLFRRGKVRDTYDLGDQLLMIATDRISAYDVVLPTGIPDKGAVLNQLSYFWFRKTPNIVYNHCISVVEDVKQLEELAQFKAVGREALGPLVGRSMLVKKAEPIMVECVVRGYLSGSGWEEYKRNGTLAGLQLPAGLRESDKLPEPAFTPATKEESGHDINISVKEMESLVGHELTKELEEKSLALYNYAAGYALERGIIIADTKFEFGVFDGSIILIDEVLTPDSSRFWAVDTYKPGGAQPSFDKQYVRDWLTASGWDREPPAPALPEEVVERTAEKYREAYGRLTGEELKR